MCQPRSHDVACVQRKALAEQVDHLQRIRLVGAANRLLLASAKPKSTVRLGSLVPPAGFEPATFGLQNRCSTN
jgi:hypothetical protein